MQLVLVHAIALSTVPAYRGLVPSLFPEWLSVVGVAPSRLNEV